MRHDHRQPNHEPVEFALLENSKADQSSRTLQPGPFESRQEKSGAYPSETARTFATTVLVLYPVVATVAVVLVSLFLTGASRSA